MRRARTPEAEWMQVLRGSMSTGAKEDESSNGCIWAAGFHHVLACSRLAGVLKLMNLSSIFSGRGEPRILNQQIEGHTYVCVCVYIYQHLTFLMTFYDLTYFILIHYRITPLK
jgi:hypothetical protein